MKRTVTTLKQDTKFGYTRVAEFIQDMYEQGGTTYELRVFEDWHDGHITYPVTGIRSYTRFRSKQEGNSQYKALLREGYTVVGKETFVPTEMDMK
jgi:hypothetical protein